MKANEIIEILEDMIVELELELASKVNLNYAYSLEEIMINNPTKNSIVYSYKSTICNGLYNDATYEFTDFFIISITHNDVLSFVRGVFDYLTKKGLRFDSITPNPSRDTNRLTLYLEGSYKYV